MEEPFNLTFYKFASVRGERKSRQAALVYQNIANTRSQTVKSFSTSGTRKDGEKFFYGSVFCSLKSLAAMGWWLLQKLNLNTNTRTYEAPPNTPYERAVNGGTFLNMDIESQIKLEYRPRSHLRSRGFSVPHAQFYLIPKHHKTFVLDR